ncbi:hypothetical protein E6W39_07790 [Kitasatospora acidiphila]|uniref:Uncharacterized protein n=1 Tax=Kitasatospora acidiphila TaxID=2567942 RepID=A0A540VZN2_9ACTN|nr:hypothetical protein [Kitasatospora acidiphila]TQF02191.1 hypothetical protein E6W39_07790 [Kitasatospora acidiphila]
MPRIGRPSGMTASRVFLFCLGIVLLLGAVVIALVHVPEPLPGMHCFARSATGRVCPDVRYVRHTGIAIGMTVAAAALIAGSLLRRRRP